MSGFGRSLSFCAVRVVRWGPIFETPGMVEGTCRAAPEELRRRSLELRAERVDCWFPEEEPTPPPPPAAGFDEEEEVVGNEGTRRGGLAVET